MIYSWSRFFKREYNYILVFQYYLRGEFWNIVSILPNLEYTFVAFRSQLTFFLDFKFPSTKSKGWEHKTLALKPRF